MNEIKETRLEVVDKTSLSKSIARRMGLTIIDAIGIIDVLQDEIIKAIKENKKVQLNGFLVFMPKDVEGRTIVSPLDKQEYVVPAKRTVDVRVGKYFKDTIRDSYKPREEAKNDSHSKPRRTRKKQA